MHFQCVAVIDIFTSDVLPVFGVVIHANVSRQDFQFLKSPFFPINCCQPIVFSILYEDIQTKGHIHLAFDDLDLPPSATLKVSHRYTLKTFKHKKNLCIFLCSFRTFSMFKRTCWMTFEQCSFE